MSTIYLRDVYVKYPESQPSGLGNVVSSMMGSSKGTAEELSVQPRTHALMNVSLEIHHGETMGILGPSGCGKTTLLRAVAGLMPIERGVITYDDRDMAAVPPG